MNYADDMVYRVDLSARAKRDLTSIADWLEAERAGDAGLRWLQGLRNSIQSLEQSPRRCQVAEESRFVSHQIRQLLYGRNPHTYRILFTIEDDAVTILTIRHGRRIPVALR